MAKILVVDDSRTDRRLIADALVGHTVIEASDGDEGIEKARTHCPNLIILDVVMPKKNGFQACRELRRMAETATTPIIVLTTKDQPTDRDWAMRQGASEYLTKPFSDEDLMAIVRSYL
jgi:twitching motility two-component system response regulator PilH